MTNNTHSQNVTHIRSAESSTIQFISKNLFGVCVLCTAHMATFNTGF